MYNIIQILLKQYKVNKNCRKTQLTYDQMNPWSCKLNKKFEVLFVIKKYDFTFKYIIPSMKNITWIHGWESLFYSKILIEKHTDGLN